MTMRLQSSRGNVLLISPGGQGDNAMVALLMHTTGMGVTQANRVQHLPKPIHIENIGKDGEICWAGEDRPSADMWPNALVPALIASCGLIDPRLVRDNKGDLRRVYTTYDAEGLAKVSHIPYVDLSLGPVATFGALMLENASSAYSLAKKMIPILPTFEHTVPMYCDPEAARDRIGYAMRTANVIVPTTLVTK